MQIIADAVGSGVSTLTAWLLVNNQREVKELPSVCISAVGTYIAKLKPLVEKVRKEKHRSLDKNAPTCKAIFLWCLQFSLRLNLMTVVYARSIPAEKKIIEAKEGKSPKEFDTANLTYLFVDQFVKWDEFHRKVIPRYDDGYICTLYKDHIMKFPHNNNGKLDVSNGTYSREKVTFTRCKYTDEVRLCLGVSSVTPVIDVVEQPQEGRR